MQEVGRMMGMDGIGIYWDHSSWRFPFEEMSAQLSNRATAPLRHSNKKVEPKERKETQIPENFADKETKKNVPLVQFQIRKV